MQGQDNHSIIKALNKPNVLTIGGWIFGIVFLLLGLVLTFSSPLPGLFNILAGLSIFPPFWKAVKRKNGWTLTRKYRIALFIAFFLMSVIASQPEPTQTQSAMTSTIQPSTMPSATSTPKYTPTPTKQLSLEERIKAKVRSDGSVKVTDVSIDTDLDPVTNKDLPGKIAVVITYHMDGTYLDTGWAKRGSWNIDAGFIKDVFPVDDSINTVVMIAEVPVTTAFGNDTFDTLDSITITRDTYSQVNFSKFDSQNLPTIADHYMESQNIK